MRLRKIICLVLALTILMPAACLHAQTTPPNTSAMPVITDYYLGPEDVLGITVINFANLSMPQVTVMPDGTISLPLLDSVAVAGKTIAEVKEMITTKWRRYVINPVVNVALIQRRTESVHILGYVGHPGKMEYKPGKRLLELLSEVGGALPEGDLSQVTLTRKTGERLTLDLTGPGTKAGSDSDPILQVGDLVYVPQRHMEISVVGYVARPGSLEFRDEMHVLDALTLVGGVLETADLSGSTLIHNGKEQKLDLDAMLRHGDLSGDIKLLPGDRILVPELKNRTYVFGAVGKPGFYLFKPGDRVLDALNGSGGPLRDANMQKINRIRVDKATNKPVVTTVDMTRFFKKGDTAPNLLLEPGDVLYIANSKHVLSFQEVLGVMSGISLVGTLGRMF